MTGEKWESPCGRVVLYCGDCLEVLPTIGKVDAVVTDPPYAVGFKYLSHDDSPEAYDGGYGNWLFKRIEAAESICNPCSPVFVWQAAKHVPIFHSIFPRDWRLFIAAKNFVQMRPCAMQYAFDPVVVWWTPGTHKPWAEGTASRDFHIANTAGIVSNTTNVEKGHPCPRPLDQVSHVIEQWVRIDSIVVDLFMGSGTTGVAAVKLGRRFIGIEKEPTYFEIAKRRIMDALGMEVSVNGVKQRRMFT